MLNGKKGMVRGMSRYCYFWRTHRLRRRGCRVWVVVVVIVMAVFADYTDFRCSSSSSHHRLGHPVISLARMFQSAGAAVGLSCSRRDPCWRTLPGGLLVET